MQGPRAGEHIRTRRREAVHLLPGGVANPFRPQLVRKAVENPNVFLKRSHRLSKRKEISIGDNRFGERRRLQRPFIPTVCRPFMVNKLLMPQFQYEE